MPVQTTIAHIIVEKEVARIDNLQIPTKHKREQLTTYLSQLKFALGNESEALVKQVRMKWKNCDGRSRQERKLKKKVQIM